jgi:hypothetical protein
MKLQLASAVMIGIACLGGAALAEEKAAHKGAIETLPDIVISLKPPRPHVMVDLVRMSHKMPLAELKQPLMGRIEQAVEKDPF